MDLTLVQTLRELLRDGGNVGVLVVVLLAWDAGRKIAQALQVLERIEQIVKTNGDHVMQVAEETEAKLDNVHTAVSKLPIEMLKLRLVR